MAREKIEIAKGAILPIQRTLWSAAIEKLEEAIAGLQLMQDANDRIAFEQGWTKLIDSLVVFWVRFFDEGKQEFSSFQPWAGRKEVECKGDELLTYLNQARHQSQHGRFAFEWDDFRLQIAPNFNGHIESLSIFPDNTFAIGATPLPGSMTKAVVRFDGGQARLPIIKNLKTKNDYAPPTNHLGRHLGQISPIQAAELGIDYYSSILREACVKFVKADTQL